MQLSVEDLFSPARRRSQDVFDLVSDFVSDYDTMISARANNKAIVFIAEPSDEFKAVVNPDRTIVTQRAPRGSRSLTAGKRRLKRAVSASTVEPSICSRVLKRLKTVSQKHCEEDDSDFDLDGDLDWDSEEHSSMDSGSDAAGSSDSYVSDPGSDSCPFNADEECNSFQKELESAILLILLQSLQY